VNLCFKKPVPFLKTFCKGGNEIRELQRALLYWYKISPLHSQQIENISFYINIWSFTATWQHLVTLVLYFLHCMHSSARAQKSLQHTRHFN